MTRSRSGDNQPTVRPRSSPVFTTSVLQTFLERIFWSKGNTITTRYRLFKIFNVFKAKWTALEWRKVIQTHILAREIGWGQPELGSIVTCQPLHQCGHVISFFFVQQIYWITQKSLDTWGKMSDSDCQVSCASSHLLSSLTNENRREFSLFLRFENASYLRRI